MAALAGGLPSSVSGMSIDRQCSSGMMAIATAAKQILYDGMDIVIGGGVESISLVQNEHMNTHRLVDKPLVAQHPHIYMPMLQTVKSLPSGTIYPVRHRMNMPCKPTKNSSSTG